MNNINIVQLKGLLLKYKYVATALVAVLLVVVFALNKNNQEDLTIITPTYGDLKETVQATGVVTSKTDLNLSFNKQGVVKSIKVEVGDKVKEGQLIATLDTNSEYGSVIQARGALLAAQARLKSVVEGSSNEEIKLAEVLLENAKRDYENTKNTQETLVKNAYNKMLNSTLEAVSSDSTGDTNPPTVSGVYSLGREGILNVNVYNTNGGKVFSVSGLTSGTGNVTNTTPQPLGNSGLYIVFPSNTNANVSNWIINIPNKKASDYLTNENAYQSALKTEQSAISSALALVNQRQAELDIKKAKAKTSEIELAEADVVSAQGVLQQAQAVYEDNIIKAPSNGTITAINIKYGELAEARTTAVVLQDVENLYVEALINESNINSVKLGQRVEISFDAINGEKFTGTVSHIDPSSVASDGVVNFKIKVSIEEDNSNIRPGMNSEITIFAFEKSDVVSVPKAYITEREGKSFVNVLTDEKNKKYKETEVSLGAIGDGNMVEIVSGLNKDEKIVIVNSK